MSRILLFLLLLTACEPAPKETNRVLMRLAITPSAPTNFVPTPTELALARRLVLQRVASYNAEQAAFSNNLKKGPDTLARSSDDLLHFDHYCKQCRPQLNRAGEKVLVFNCLCDIKLLELLHWDWRRDYVRVRDGDNCYFAISVNLAHQTVFDFAVNEDD